MFDIVLLVRRNDVGKKAKGCQSMQVIWYKSHFTELIQRASFFLCSNVINICFSINCALVALLNGMLILICTIS